MAVITARHTASVWPLALAGAAAVLTVAAGARLLERARFGPDDASTLERVERDVRGDVVDSAKSLTEVVHTIRTEPRLLESITTRQPDVRSLFDILERVGRVRVGSDISLTIFGADGRALAWSGRPSSLPADRLSGPAALFVAPGTTGLRLVYVDGIAAEGRGARRAGSIVAERLLSPVSGDPSSPWANWRLDTSIVPVTLRPRFEGAQTKASPGSFAITAPNGELLVEALIDQQDIARERMAWREGGRAATLGVLSLWLLMLVVPLVDLRQRAGRASGYMWTTLAIVGLIVGVRAIAWWAIPTSVRGASNLFESSAFEAPFFRILHRTPIDFLFTGMAAAALAAVALSVVMRTRVAWRYRRDSAGSPLAFLGVFVSQVLAGVVAVALVVAFDTVLAATVDRSLVDVLYLSFQPWDAGRVATAAGLLFLHAAVVATVVAIFQTALLPWRVPSLPRGSAWLVFAGWTVPAMALTGATEWLADPLPRGPILLVVIAAALAAWLGRRGVGWFRHGSQALRLAALALALILPALLLYPQLLHFATEAKRRQIATHFAQQAMAYPQELLRDLRQSLSQIDQTASLAPTLAGLEPVTGRPPTDAAFAVWRQTELAVRRLTSAIELYGRHGRLVGRFALNFPEYTAQTPRWTGGRCRWDVFGEAAPFGAEERRMLHAERAVCDENDHIVGAIIVHVLPDYSTLPFISPHSPYFEFVRGEAIRPGQSPGDDVGLTIYGWGRTPLFTSSGVAWTLDDELFARIFASREPFWTTLSRGGIAHHVFVGNDRYGIYLLDYPAPGVFDHLVHLAELTTLSAAAFVGLVLLAAVLRPLVGARSSGRHLVREIRTSFYRKLFLAFVAAAVIPVVTLALATRTYVAAQMRTHIEAEASRTAAVAQRVVEEWLATEQPRDLPSGGARFDDDVMVWISRVLDQDVNIFDGPQLVATSERDLFASGLLPTRTPDHVYRAIVLERQPSYIGEDQIADLRYLTAAAPIRSTGRETLLTVPLALRQREIEREIEELDRGILLGAIAFILFGAGIGFWMAERIGDPVQRLTNASRRIAAGDLDARVFVRSADELQRLVESFNSMAYELQRQRVQLERTNRLEAWAEMARQVAHDIKNPLTPIQLSAEHLRRVHQDQGRPLSPVLDACVDTILTQVRLLRQIASEFSSFATTPVARPAPTVLNELVREVTGAYATGLSDRIHLVVDEAPALPVISIDRTLIGRALTNVIENALHAMPGAGTLTVGTRQENGSVVITVSDTGVGMDRQSLARIFEPYFSTKATGTGLGLAIARRNVELHSGTITVESQKGIGTTVQLSLPVAGQGGSAPPVDEPATVAAS